MNNSLLAGVILGGVVITAVGAYASTRVDLPWEDYADVVAVEPAFDFKQVARQVCNDEAVTQQVPVKDAGGLAGSKVQKRMQEGKTETGMEQRCETVYDSEKTPAGFQVTYLLDGKQALVRMDHDPGRRIRVEDGELVLTKS